MKNNKEYKYVMIVTSEDERYDSGEKDLSWFGEHPWEGTLEKIIFGNSFDELMGDGHNEGLFQQTYEMETGKRLSYGFLDPDTPREEIEEWEENYSPKKANGWKDLVIEVAKESGWDTTIKGANFIFDTCTIDGVPYKFTISNVMIGKELVNRIRKHYIKFDISKETYKLLDWDGRGDKKKGVPTRYSMKVMLNNVDEIENRIKKLVDNLDIAIKEWCEENRLLKK